MAHPRLALTRTEAARALGLSLTAFEQHVLPELGVLKVGRRVLVPVRELEQWVERHTLPPSPGPAPAPAHTAGGRCAPAARVALLSARR